MRVFFWAADASGCGWYRCTCPARGLRKLGHDVTVAMVLPPWVPTHADVIVGQRVCLPGPSGTWQALARQGRSKMVYEIDDNLFDIDPSNVAAHLFFRGEIVDNLRRNIEVADLVTVTTAALAHLIEPINPNVVVPPNSVPDNVLDIAREPSNRPGVTLGWSGGGSHAVDLDEIAVELPRFLGRNPGVELHTIGTPAKAFVRALPGAQHRHSPWLDSVGAFYRAIDFDVSLAPLRPSVFNRAKSAIRCLEAAALGIPVVATDHGPYAAFVQHGVTGLLVRQTHEWSRHLRDLVSDPDYRADMGAAARRQAAQFTVSRQAPAWARALDPASTIAA